MTRRAAISGFVSCIALTWASLVPNRADAQSILSPSATAAVAGVLEGAVKRGVGAVLLMQYLPFYDEAAIRTLREFEAAVYQYLAPPR